MTSCSEFCKISVHPLGKLENFLFHIQRQTPGSEMEAFPAVRRAEGRATGWDVAPRSSDAQSPAVAHCFCNLGEGPHESSRFHISQMCGISGASLLLEGIFQLQVNY